jgi:adenylate kinase family enzyme
MMETQRSFDRPVPDAAPRRVSVVGTTGSGKTTLAGELARRLGLRHIELDALHWGPGWALPTREAFRERVGDALKDDGWVADGNYSAVRDMVWGRAQMVVWLDYALPVFMGRLIHRTLRRAISGEELWNGNRERLHHLFRRDSLWLWALQTYRRRRREYPKVFAQAEYAHLEVVRLRSPRRAGEWLARWDRSDAT